MDITFQTSYTLDLLYFIDLLLINGPHDLAEDLEYFRGYMTRESELSADYLKKNLKYGQTLQQLVAPLLVADPEFSVLSLGEMLVSSRYLITSYKASPAYRKSSLQYQRFLHKEAPQFIVSLEPLVRDLERGGFKDYWLRYHLPLLKKRINGFSQPFDWGRLGQHLSTCATGKLQIYVSPLAQTDIASFGNNCYAVTYEATSQRIANYLVAQIVEEAIAGIQWGPVLVSIPQREEIRKAKAWGQSMGSYVKKSARLALECFIKEECGLILSAEQQLLDMEKGSYQLALLLYGHMKHSPQKEEALEIYLAATFQQLDLRGLQDIGKLKIA